MNLKENIQRILREETKDKILYPFDKIGKFVKWFNDEYGDYQNKQGWAIFDSDSEIPNEKYNSVRTYKGKTLSGYYWQIQRLDNPGDNEALFGKLSSDFEADRMARKLSIMVDEYGVIYGYDGVSFLDNNIQESILKEVRVPREERVELYKDNNIIVIVPLSHRALQKYAHRCQWCINDDKGEWEDYHQKKHAVIIQRKPKKNKKGITGMETEGEIFLLSKLDEGNWDWGTVTQTLGYDFDGSKEKALDYFVEISNDINNFNLNIVYYSPENGIYDMEDNFLWNYDYEISDIPNVTDEVIDIMDEYLTQE